MLLFLFFSVALHAARPLERSTKNQTNYFTDSLVVFWCEFDSRVVHHPSTKPQVHHSFLDLLYFDFSFPYNTKNFHNFQSVFACTFLKTFSSAGSPKATQPKSAQHDQGTFPFTATSTRLCTQYLDQHCFAPTSVPRRTKNCIVG